MNGAASWIEKIARPKNVTTSERTLLTGVFWTTIARANPIASTDAIVKTTSSPLRAGIRSPSGARALPSRGG